MRSRRTVAKLATDHSEVGGVEGIVDSGDCLSAEGLERLLDLRDRIMRRLDANAPLARERDRESA